MLNNYFWHGARKRYWHLVWCVLASSLAAAQPTLVKDLVTSGTDPLTGANSFKPNALTGVNGVVYFSAFDPVNGRELWRSDGTAAGTFMLRDIIPGTISSEPAELAAVNNTLYFSASDGKSGRELWKTDGTLVGTVRVKDIAAGTTGSSPTNLVNVGGTLYFSANDGDSGRELWKSDGTSGGTVRVKDILVGTGSADPADLISMNGTLYFAATDGVSGRELWKSNGTAAGTILVKDIYSGPTDSNPVELISVSGILYFATHGGLWKSNGTNAGTVLISGDFFEGPWELTNVNGTIFFSAWGASGEEWEGIELWKSNGTAAGTVLVKNIEPYYYNRWYDYHSSFPSELTNVNGTLYFAATKTDDQSGRELWKSDGTATGTVMAADLFPGTYEIEYRPYGPQGEYPNDGNPSNLINVNGTLYCTTYEGLWKREGTGIVLLKATSQASNLANVNGTLFLAVRDDMGGTELWKSNGVATGTVAVKTNPSSIPAGSYPQHAINMGGTLYFAAGNPAGAYDLWKSDGTNAGTTLVAGVGSSIRGLTNAGGKLFFVSSDGNYAHLSKSNGTAEGTYTVKSFYLGTGGPGPYGLTALNGVVYFGAQEDTLGTELWRSDGTEAGTYQVKDIYPGEEYDYSDEDQQWQWTYFSSDPKWLTVLNGKLYFIANSSSGQEELWVSDGTGAGTSLVKNASQSHSLTNLNGTLYFISSDGSGQHLWKSNGTASGTVKVKDTPARSLFKAGNWLYFWSDAGQLWRSNGTAAGTTIVKSIAESSNQQFLTTVGSLVYFTTEHYTNGHELWRSDGTDAGTYLLKNITSGAVGSDIASFAALGSELYFSTAPAGGAPVLWKSNGTTAGTLKVTSLPASGLTAMNGVLYFSANDGLLGFELWRYNPATCVTPSTATAIQGSTVCLGSPATVTVKIAQAGVRYSLYYGDSPFGLPKVGSGTDLSFSISAASLFTGSYTFSVKAEGCREVTLSATATVTVTSPLTAPLANGVTINSGQTATLTASGAPLGATYRWYAAATGGTPLATTATYTTPALSTTTTYYVALYQLPCGESPRRAVTVTVNGGTAAKSFRVNAGGSAFSTIDARNFAADVYFSGGVVTTPTNLAIAGTADDFLYQTGRHGTSFTYNFPTGSGSYDVILHFAETYYGNTAPGGIGSRKFHVDAEGARRLTDYDVFAKAGGALRARQETFRVNVSDGTLTVAFLKGSTDNPAVKAIEVLPAGSALAINSGGSNFRTAAGKAFSSDVYYADGAPTTAVAGDVLNTTDDALYHTGRSGPAFSYGLPSGNGTFDVTLHFAETYYGKQVAGGVGSRKFNVYLEGVKQLSDYDIFAKAGGAMRAVKETRRITVSDGVLNLYFAKGLAGNAYVSAVEVVPVAVAARKSAEPEVGSEEWQVQLYPNPVLDVLIVLLSFPAEAVRGTVVADAAGAALLVNTHRATAEGNLQVRVSQLKRGLYLLHLDTDRGRRVIKFIKQ
jgi:ELWxxDGT repeat protein